MVTQFSEHHFFVFFAVWGIRLYHTARFFQNLPCALIHRACSDPSRRRHRHRQPEKRAVGVSGHSFLTFSKQLLIGRIRRAPRHCLSNIFLSLMVSTISEVFINMLIMFLRRSRNSTPTTYVCCITCICVYMCLFTTWPISIMIGVFTKSIISKVKVARRDPNQPIKPLENTRDDFDFWGANKI